MRLKVLFLTAWYPSEENPVTGVFVREHAKAVGIYNDVIVLFPRAAGKGQNAIIQVSDAVEHGIRTVRVTYRRPGGLPVLPMLMYYLAVRAGWRHILAQGFQPDVIHGHVCTVGIPALHLAARGGIPLVFTEHSSGFPRYNLPWYDVLSARVAYPRADMVCPVSHDLADHIASYGIEARFQVVPNAVNGELFTVGVKESGGIKKILTVAMCDPIKGIPFLLQAVSLVGRQRRDFVLDVVGDGPCRPEYEKMAGAMGLTGVVRFHGRKSKSEVAEFMRESDLLVVSSLWENMPCVLAEAMACGNPVVATAVGGIPEVVSPRRGKLVPPGDARALGIAIAEMLDTLPDYDPRVIASYARETFGHEAVGRAYDSCYREVVKTDPAGGRIVGRDPAREGRP